MSSVLVACERSGIVSAAFRAQGVEAFSCDLEGPAETADPAWHIVGDVYAVLQQAPWQLLIFHPPCTYLCSSGLHWNKRRPERASLTETAFAFAVTVFEQAKVRYAAMENPVGCLSTRYRKPDQILQPWQFGDDASKATCLWLRNLPPLSPLELPLPGNHHTIRSNQTLSGANKLSPSADRAYLRARTYPGIARAMAFHWAPLLHTRRTRAYLCSPTP